MATSRDVFAFSAVLVAIPLCGCAHKNGGVVPLSAPAAPVRDVSVGSEEGVPASVNRVRGNRDDPRRAGPATTPFAPRATDRPDSPGQATGTSWSVVIESAPGTRHRKGEPVPRPASADVPPEPEPAADRPTWQRWLDVVGGSVASVCCALALRRRARRPAAR